MCCNDSWSMVKRPIQVLEIPAPRTSGSRLQVECSKWVGRYTTCRPGWITTVNLLWLKPIQCFYPEDALGVVQLQDAPGTDHCCPNLCACGFVQKTGYPQYSFHLVGHFVLFISLSKLQFTMVYQVFAASPGFCTSGKCGVQRDTGAKRRKLEEEF
jgi:hypothetical protein